ncbi:MAG: hypothetical protein B0D96_02565 [Candidatus Sedimenticola endophacoides]|uniref:UPF0761 membrane protein B0D84_02220 n=1 Tax=Candidatus Sedimenticola endophacoides TaxID=2548426 RepID=A0A657PPI8_9GAMM|nr:MAG: hypothetical protein B0D94_04095 [Candidatus Sedimenticola endophacoides]OQX35631.1 MAG: hypothetical protein B0D84_02220 [Candidatus Sedimenticola endophacoides]OQX37218.1 MAG: hypothetical protein B0D96_02565 [Candidatus Sedimenticola endophacoides]OQX41384.1 MAG: hypothetical protein B0D89_04240 [Candidatus Sedimenticola endophacoides]PUE00966.1 MAG: hypothetical protein C3L26_04485 [Candidatus Sedimenticola endophacoides]
MSERARIHLAGWVVRSRHFLRLLLSRFVEDQGLPNAAALTYTTLLSLVPLMTVTLAVFAAFPVSDRVADEIQDFLFENFVPTSGEVLEQYLQQFSAKASRLSGAGFAFLVVVALMMMGNIDRAFNTIWRVRKKRGPLNTFMVYWAILSLGPILMGVSVAVTSYIVSIPLFSDVTESFGVGRRLLGLTPVLASAFAFTLLYTVVPNRSVPVRHALAGGLLAAILFESAKRGFALYLTHFPTYEAIYGALAVIPIFLIWIYLSWIVTLLGAEFTYCLGIFHDEARASERGRGDAMLLAYRILGRLWQAQQRGEAQALESLSRGLGGVAEERLEGLLEQLRQARLVLRTDSGEWALARDLSEVTLLDLYHARPFVLPHAELLAQSADGPGQALGRILGEAGSDLEARLSVDLERLYRTSQDTP